VTSRTPNPTTPIKEQTMTEQPTADHAATFDQFETTEQRQARWEAAAFEAGREVDRNALRVYLAVADAEQQKLADSWASALAASDAEIVRLKVRVRELERPAVEAKRAEIRQSLVELAAQAEQDRDFEGAFDVQCRLREFEERWALEDDPSPAPSPAVALAVASELSRPTP
jgi:hypothetical protein